MKELRVLTPTSLVVDTSIYAAADSVGGLLSFSHASNLRTASGTIRGLVIGDAVKQAAVLSLLLFSSNPTGSTFTDNAAIAIAVADLPKIIGKINIVAANYTAFSVTGVGNLDDLYIKYQVNGGATPDADTAILYGALYLVSGTPTWTGAGNLSLQLKVEMD